MPDFYSAREAFSYAHNGVEHIVTPGKVFAADHPVLRGRTHLFEPIESAVVRGSETASAAPGELRGPSPAAADKEAVEAWLAAETKYGDDVQDWLAAEEQHLEDVAAWLTAEAAEKADDDTPGEKKTTRTRARH